MNERDTIDSGIVKEEVHCPLYRMWEIGFVIKIKKAISWWQYVNVNIFDSHLINIIIYGN